MKLMLWSETADLSVIESIGQHAQCRAVQVLSPQLYQCTDAQPFAQLPHLCQQHHIDFAWLDDVQQRDHFKLFVTDMDSTLINIECIDEMARIHGCYAKITQITAAAMRGEIDFATSLIKRVALLEGLAEEKLRVIFEQRLKLNPGAETLLHQLKSNGLVTAVVSGGFTFFTQQLQHQLSLDESHANQLEVIDGKLSGKLSGPLVDAQAKVDFIEKLCTKYRFNATQVIAVGDGANDKPMLNQVGFAVAYRAKPVLQTVANCRLDHAPLDAIWHLLPEA